MMENQALLFRVCVCVCVCYGGRKQVPTKRGTKKKELP